LPALARLRDEAPTEAGAGPIGSSGVLSLRRSRLVALRLVGIVQGQSELVELRLIKIEDVVLLDLIGVTGELSEVVWVAQVVPGVIEIPVVVGVLDHGIDVGREFEV
jgi:hypothetical protein